MSEEDNYAKMSEPQSTADDSRKLSEDAQGLDPRQAGRIRIGVVDMIVGEGGLEVPGFVVTKNEILMAGVERAWTCTQHMWVAATLTSAVHDRMPVMLDPDCHDCGLIPECNPPLHLRALVFLSNRGPRRFRRGRSLAADAELTVVATTLSYTML